MRSEIGKPEAGQVKRSWHPDSDPRGEGLGTKQRQQAHCAASALRLEQNAHTVNCRSYELTKVRSVGPEWKSLRAQLRTSF